MKVVIDIPENEYRLIKEIYEKNDIVESTYSYIYHGTPLPKGHGRLIDADALWKKWVFDAIGKQEIDEAPTIIEADKESERMNELDAYIGAKIDEAVDAYDSSTESVKENIETVDDALAVSEERQKWKQAIENIKAEIKNDYHITCLEIIDKHTKELMK